MDPMPPYLVFYAFAALFGAAGGELLRRANARGTLGYHLLSCFVGTGVGFFVGLSVQGPFGMLFALISAAFWPEILKGLQTQVGDRLRDMIRTRDTSNR